MPNPEPYTLHSNMFLLIPAIWNGSSTWMLFTFQYVSINTGYIPNQQSVYISLHSNMFLLIQVASALNACTSSFTFQYVSINTHTVLLSGQRLSTFTFQYVSINTAPAYNFATVNCSLHSNMFLLIPLSRLQRKCYVSTLHSNMFLLILFSELDISFYMPLYIPICFY